MRAKRFTSQMLEGMSYILGQRVPTPYVNGTKRLRRDMFDGIRSWHENVYLTSRGLKGYQVKCWKLQVGHLKRISFFVCGTCGLWFSQGCVCIFGSVLNGSAFPAFVFGMLFAVFLFACWFRCMAMSFAIVVPGFAINLIAPFAQGAGTRCLIKWRIHSKTWLVNYLVRNS